MKFPVPPKIRLYFYGDKPKFSCKFGVRYQVMHTHWNTIWILKSARIVLRSKRPKVNYEKEEYGKLMETFLFPFHLFIDLKNSLKSPSFFPTPYFSSIFSSFLQSALRSIYPNTIASGADISRIQYYLAHPPGHVQRNHKGNGVVN